MPAEPPPRGDTTAAFGVEAPPATALPVASGDVVPSPSWEEALVKLERHVAEIRAGLERSGSMPEPYRVALPDAPLPAELEARAKQVLAEQRDLEVALRERMGIISGAMHRDPHLRRAMVALYLDKTA